MATTQRIGPYESLIEIGRGGMGTVHLACAVGDAVGVDGFSRLVAIKRVHQTLVSSGDSRRRFLDEARLAAHVHHANVVGIHQVGCDDGGVFMVLDYIEGETVEGLVDRLRLRRMKLPPPVALRIAVDALSGLAAVHEARGPSGAALDIIHRDVSIQNLLVGSDGVTRLADFGIAKGVTSSAITDQSYLLGRLLYMAPEHLRRAPTDRRLDVYAMGVTLWVALAGREPWPGASEAQIVRAAIEDGVPPLSTADVTVAPSIEEIVRRACERDASRRFPSARAMLEAIETLGRDTGWIASHSDVARLVEEVGGEELMSRREQVRAALGAIQSSRDASAWDTEDGVTRPTAPRATGPRAFVAVAIASVVLGGLALAAVSGLGAPTQSASPAPAASILQRGRDEVPHEPPLHGTQAAASDATVRASRPVLPDSESTRSRSQNVPARPPSSSRGIPTRAPQSSTGGITAPSAETSARRSERAGTPADGITKDNPYR